MSFEIIITSFAEYDLLDALEYYNSKKTGLGDELVDELDKVFKMIEGMRQLSMVEIVSLDSGCDS